MNKPEPTQARFAALTTAVGTPLPPPPYVAAPPRRSLAPVAAGAVLLALGCVSTWAATRQMDAFLNGLDVQAVQQASKVLDRSVERQRTYLLSEVGVLADDTRIRASVMTPDFNEATVKDILDDLKTASGASILAVLDLQGKVRAVSGAQVLRNVDLGASPLIKEAQERPAAYVWSFPDRVLIVGAAAIHSGTEASALFLMAFELGSATLNGIRDMLAVDGAVLVGDRIVASSTSDPDRAAAFRRAATLDEDQERLVAGSPHPFLMRVVRANKAGGAGKIAFLVPHHHQAAQAGLLRAMTAVPAVMGVLAALLALALTRKTTQGEIK